MKEYQSRGNYKTKGNAIFLRDEYRNHKTDYLVNKGMRLVHIYNNIFIFVGTKYCVEEIVTTRRKHTHKRVAALYH